MKLTHTYTQKKTNQPHPKNNMCKFYPVEGHVLIQKKIQLNFCTKKKSQSAKVAEFCIEGEIKTKNCRGNAGIVEYVYVQSDIKSNKKCECFIPITINETNNNNNQKPEQFGRKSRSSAKTIM